MSAIYYTDENGEPLRPPRWWIGYLCGAFLTFLGIVVPCGGTLGLFVAFVPEPGISAPPPATIRATIDHAERMVIWVEEPDDSPTRHAIAIPDDLRAVVKDPARKPVIARTPQQDLTSFGTHFDRRAALIFDARSPGIYTSRRSSATFQPQQSVECSSPDDTYRDAAFGLWGYSRAAGRRRDAHWRGW